VNVKVKVLNAYTKNCTKNCKWQGWKVYCHAHLMYSSVLYFNFTLLYFILLYPTLLCSAVLFCTVVYWTVLYSTLLYSTLIYTAVLYCTVLSSTVLFYTLHCATSNNRHKISRLCFHCMLLVHWEINLLFGVSGCTGYHVCHCILYVLLSTCFWTPWYYVHVQLCPDLCSAVSCEHCKFIFLCR
jgi:hypothetical protein